VSPDVSSIHDEAVPIGDASREAAVIDAVVVPYAPSATEAAIAVPISAAEPVNTSVRRPSKSDHPVGDQRSGAAP
jgi:hypothetical protein